MEATNTFHGLELENKPGHVSCTETNKLPYPKATIFILLCKFGDWMAINGAKAVLVLYFTRYLAYDKQDATMLFHTFLASVYLMVIIGALIADSWLGKYKTVLYMYISYVIGFVVLVLGSIPVLEMPSREFTVVGLFLIALATGSMKPCINALGGDQFKLPEQSKQMGQYYSIVAFSVATTNLLASALTPILRNDVKCFGQEHCFPLAFGVSGMMVLFTFAIFLAASGWIVKNKPVENVTILTIKCMWYGAILRIRNRCTDPKDHWLDHAIPKFGAQFVNDVKALLNINIIFLPIPMFWALLDQTGSRWVLHATLLNGDIGIYNIKPDQINFILPLMVMVFIPLFDLVIYPALLRVGIKTDLQRLVVGTFLACLSFVAAGVLEYTTLPTIDQNSTQTINPSDTFHMLWMIPQYVLLAMGECMVAIIGYRFTYSQAPGSMKAVFMACWSLTKFFGNCIVLVVMSFRLFEVEAFLTFFFAALMFLDVLWFIWLVKRYKRISVD